MKLKILSAIILSVAMCIPFTNDAEAEVPSGFGLGYQGMFLGNLLNGASGRYWMDDNVGLEMDVFHLYADVAPAVAGVSTAHLVDFMGKALYAPVVKENSRFYLGAQIGYARALIPNNVPDVQLLVAGPLMGAEYSFQGLPELGFNFEVGYIWNYAFAGDDPNDLDLHVLGINVTFGVHYYF